MDNLKDIKPLVIIADNSFIYLVIIIFIALLMLLILGYYIRKKLQLKRCNSKRIALNILKNLDFNDSKTTAYTFSHYASVLVNDRNIMDFEKINTALLDYKYKKQVNQLEKNLVEQIKVFLDGSFKKS